MSYPTDPIKDNVKMSKRPNVSVYFDNGVKWIQIGKLPGDERSHVNLSQGNSNSIQFWLLLLSNCQAVRTGDWWPVQWRQWRFANSQTKWPPQAWLSQARLCLFLSHHFWRPLWLPDLGGSAWPQPESPTTCQEARKWERWWRQVKHINRVQSSPSLKSGAQHKHRMWKFCFTKTMESSVNRANELIMYLCVWCYGFLGSPELGSHQ